MGGYNLVENNFNTKTKFYKLSKLPLHKEPNSIYFIEDGNYVELYITDNRGRVKPVLDIDRINELIDIKIAEISPIEAKELTDYRSDFETTDLYIYSGYLLEGDPIIKRYKDSIYQDAQNVTDLEIDWTNRLSLTYI